MNIACKDLAALSIQTALNAQQKELKQKYNTLKKESQQNKFLVGVVRDYAKHLNYMKNQKKEQVHALRKIADYIDRISQDTTTTERMLEQTKEDQKELTKDINVLRKEINEIIIDDNDLADDK
tara:strand:+ start:168 stop:536 length:369 start_codon:yes stop_codon:yes gene_type:complete